MPQGYADTGVSGLSTADLPLPQRLALSYAPARARTATHAFLALDARLAAILRARREPLTVQLRLAWWRETLGKPVNAWPAGEPLLSALSGWRDPSALAGLPDAWESLLADALTPAAIAAFVAGRANGFAALARQLGAADEAAAADAAEIWALADLAEHLGDGAERELVVEYGRAKGPPPRLPASLRALAVLAALGAAALERGGGALLSGPRSVLLALRIGLSGR
ncbi:MAG: hypothetical protein B7Z08_08715 [Sphingomonadales bacterium 32-68-7]|nr:MAG: hypothetical protein B7Z33_04965 [Sphingomonadales bacterium 12-68-11]OYX08613.1 MAG: hypothetical protein B7Z08_08715 [Sphingomonadales bacterium 32-68-7]